MKHEDEGTLMAFLDGALPPSRRTAVAAHIEGCAECRATLESLRRASDRFAAALEPMEMESSIDEARLRRAGAAIRIAPSAPPVGRALLRAAVLVLGFAAIASAAIPGSPVGGWIRGVWPEPRQTPAPTAATDDRATDPTAESGVSITPVRGRLDVHILEAAQSSIVRVRVVTDSKATVRAAEARYRTGPGRIEVLNAAGGEIFVDLPRSVPHAEVRVDGRVLVSKSGEALNWIAPEVDDGSEVWLPIGGH